MGVIALAKTPFAPARTTIQNRLICPAIDSIINRNAVAAIIRFNVTAVLRRLTRSAITPKTGPRIKAGAKLSAAINPVQNADPVNDHANHDMAIFCTQSPCVVMHCPIRNRTKLRS